MWDFSDVPIEFSFDEKIFKSLDIKQSSYPNCLHSTETAKRALVKYVSPKGEAMKFLDFEIGEGQVFISI